jgi:hypothetical protein
MGEQQVYLRPAPGRMGEQQVYLRPAPGRMGEQQVYLRPAPGRMGEQPGLYGRSGNAVVANLNIKYIVRVSLQSGQYLAFTLALLIYILIFRINIYKNDIL